MELVRYDIGVFLDGILPELYHNPVGEACNRQERIADSTLMYTEFVRTIGGNNGDASGADFYDIGTIVVAYHLECVGCSYFLQRNRLKQQSVLINISYIVCLSGIGK